MPQGAYLIKKTSIQMYYMWQMHQVLQDSDGKCTKGHPQQLVMKWH
jgi:hypothetical protein